MSHMAPLQSRPRATVGHVGVTHQEQVGATHLSHWEPPILHPTATGRGQFPRGEKPRDVGDFQGGSPPLLHLTLPHAQAGQQRAWSFNPRATRDTTRGLLPTNGVDGMLRVRTAGHTKEIMGPNVPNLRPAEHQARVDNPSRTHNTSGISVNALTAAAYQHVNVVVRDTLSDMCRAAEAWKDRPLYIP